MQNLTDEISVQRQVQDRFRGILHVLEHLQRRVESSGEHSCRKDFCEPDILV